MTAVTYDDVRKSEEIRTYIIQADKSLEAMGYTEHSFPHVTRCAEMASSLLNQLGYDAHMADLAKIAGYIHDIGNIVNRADHAQSGAIMAFQILAKMGMEPMDLAMVVTAIGNHDENTAFPVNAIAAALLLADKTDVRRTRVRNKKHIEQDIHDRVNYAVEKSEVVLDTEQRQCRLVLTIDPEICSVMDYFEIFLGRMLLCRKAAEYFNLEFKLIINDLALL